jgi:DNA-binding XRE family transcriptional regulator
MLSADYLEIIKQYMKNCEMNQKELAKLLQVVPNTITNWMNGGKISDKHKARIKAVCCNPAPNNRLVSVNENQEIAIPKESSSSNLDNAINGILDAIMASDMCDGCKIKAYNIIKGKWN